MTFSKNSFFVIGGCEMNTERTEKEFDELIEMTLRQVMREGFDERRIQGILNEVQFSYRQIKSRIYISDIVESFDRIWIDINAVCDGGLDSSCRSYAVFTIGRPT